MGLEVGAEILVLAPHPRHPEVAAAEPRRTRRHPRGEGEEAWLMEDQGVMRIRDHLLD